MQQTTQQKLCWNCEGHAAAHLENCPYCGVYLSPLSLNGKQESLFTPPYRQTKRMVSQDVSPPPAAYQAPASVPTYEEPQPLETNVVADALDEEKTDVVVEELQMSDDLVASKNAILAFLLLFSGSLFTLFSLVLLLFSQDGVLVLRWNSYLWPLFTLFAIPLFFFGWGCLQKSAPGGPKDKG